MSNLATFARLRPEEPTLAELMAKNASERATLARQHVEQLIAAVEAVKLTAAEITGADALSYPPGVREIAVRLEREARGYALNLQSLAGRP